MAPAEQVLDEAGLDGLISALAAQGYQVIGPTVRDNAIVLAELNSAADLPAGYGVDVGPGHYRLRRRDDRSMFAHSAGPQSWKQFLHPARRRLWSAPADGPFEPGYRGGAAVRLHRGARLRPGRHPDPGPGTRRRGQPLTAHSSAAASTCSSSR